MRCTFYGRCASYSPCTKVQIRLLWTRESLTSAICLQCLTGQSFLHHDGRFGIPLTTHKGKIKRLARLSQSNWYEKSLAWILAKIKFYDIDLQISTRTTSTTSTGWIWPGVAGKLLRRLQILAGPVVPPCGVAPGSWQGFKSGRWICKMICMANNISCGTSV